jgi:DNA modification methylase
MPTTSCRAKGNSGETRRGVNAPVAVECIEIWAIDRLIPFVGNARSHTREQIAEIAASITEFGFVNPMLVGADGIIIAGHARLLAAKELGLSQVPVIVLNHLSEIQRRALVIADNQLALNAGWDEELLREQLAALRGEDFDLELIGFDEEELSRLLADRDTVVGLSDEDAVPAVAETLVSLPGDLWQLGDHLLLCGDATKAADLERLMAGEAADLIFTDLPYNVDYQGYTPQRLNIQGDRMPAAEFRRFLSASFASYRGIVKPGASFYACHASCWQREFQNALEEAGFVVRCQIIWAKQTFAWGFGRYKFQHEPIFYGHVAGQKDAWYGDRSQSTLWEENKPAANREHPTAKPVALVERGLLNSSQAGELIVDLFGGAGSTLIASERCSRKCRLMEIDPRYVDVIVRRWQGYTGRRAVLKPDGRSFDEIAQQRSRAAQAEGNQRGGKQS